MIFLVDQDVPEAIARVIEQAGHQVHRLRDVLPIDSLDLDVLTFATRGDMILVTCNRDDFIALAENSPHAGIIVLIRRPTRVAECSHLLRLIQLAGETGLRNNINFA
jgi:predicted nuclease of predicted toxin-antitoxin system